MRRHTRIMLFMLLVMLLALTGCEKIYTGNADTQTSSDSEELTETVQETETNPETVRESVESDKQKAVHRTRKCLRAAWVTV